MLTEAARAVRELPAHHLRTKIDLWLVELYSQRGEGTAAAEALQQAERQFQGSERKGLAAWAARVRGTLQR